MHLSVALLSRALLAKDAQRVREMHSVCLARQRLQVAGYTSGSVSKGPGVTSWTRSKLAAQQAHSTAFWVPLMCGRCVRSLGFRAGREFATGDRKSVV